MLPESRADRDRWTVPSSLIGAAAAPQRLAAGLLRPSLFSSDAGFLTLTSALSIVLYKVLKALP